MTALIEYVLRLRLAEPTAEPSHGESGEPMAGILGDLEDVALETEIVSRDVLAGPDAPPRVRCAARKLDPTRHYATSGRWQLETPDGVTYVFCSGACLLSYAVHGALPADIEARHTETSAEGSNAA